MSVMILHQDFTLILLASLASYFSMHQGSHLAYLSANHTQLNPTLVLLMSIEVQYFLYGMDIKRTGIILCFLWLSVFRGLLYW